MTIGGGFHAVKSVFRYARKIGAFKLAQAVKSKNACKACAFGTGGQRGGLHNESASLIEICNKNIQAHLSDIRPPIDNTIFFKTSIAALSDFTGKQLEDLGRLGMPLYKGVNDTHYSPLTYEEAFDRIAKKLNTVDPLRSFYYASGRSSNEAAFLMQLLARLLGSNNINNCSYYCHQASGVGLKNVIGSGTATVQFSDLEKADCIFVLGANPASNHPRFVKTLLKCRRRGGQVIVVNPAKEPGLVKFASPSDFWSMVKGGEPVASEYVQINIGGDKAFLLGVAKCIIETNDTDTTFIDTFTENYQQFHDFVHSLSWSELESISGTSRKLMGKVAGIYAQSKQCIFSWGMGVTHHLHGVENIESISALALLRGMIGKTGAGLLPLRGHSNIQGMGTMGVTPQLKAQVFERLEETLSVPLPSHEGLDTMSCMQNAYDGDMDFALLCGGNLYSSNPDSNFANQALANVPFKVFISPTLNKGHVMGVGDEQIILPIKVRDEETQPTTQESMFNYIRMSDGGISRFTQLLSEVDIFCEIGKRCVKKEIVDFHALTSHQNIRKWIANVIPGFDSFNEIDNDKKEFQIPDRIFHKPQFLTESSKAVFPVLSKFSECSVENENAFVLTTVRSEGQFNSIIFDEKDTYREQLQRNVLMMNTHDMLALDLKENDIVVIENHIGKMKDLLVKPFDIKQGNVMTYYPEANVLVPKAVDARSRTPAFKSVNITITKA